MHVEPLEHELAQMRVEVLETLQDLAGKRLRIHQSLSRYRGAEGHDLPAAATLQFGMTVKQVAWHVSGGHVYLVGESAWLGILLENVCAFEREGHEILSITEQFEEETERLTTITVLS